MMPRHGMPSRRSRVSLGFLVAGFLVMPMVGCGGTAGDSGSDSEASNEETAPLTLGPLDGFDLPSTDLERVAVGTVAPDFSLETITGDTVTLSDFRGEKDVVLVFYRGHW